MGFAHKYCGSLWQIIRQTFHRHPRKIFWGSFYSITLWKIRKEKKEKGFVSWLSCQMHVIQLQFFSLQCISCLDTLWQYGLWSFQTGGTKLKRFLLKNQHAQRKLLNFENWVNVEVRDIHIECSKQLI